MKRLFFYYIIFSIVYLCVSQKTYAQSAFIDSLKKILPGAKNDSAKIDLLTQLSKHYDNVDSFISKNYYQQAEAIALKSKNDIYLAKVKELAGTLCTRYDQQKALQYYNEAVLLLSRHQQLYNVKKQITSLKNNMGVIHYLNGDFEGALVYFFEAIHFYENHDPTNYNLGFGYGNVATTFMDLKKYENANLYAKKNVSFAESGNNKNLQMSAYINYGSSLIKIKKYGGALIQLQKAKLIADQLNNNYNLNLYHTNMGDYLMLIKNYNSALESYKNALLFSKKINSPPDICVAQANIGICLLSLNEYNASQINLSRALNIAEENKLRAQEQIIYETLAELNEKKANFKTALLYKNRSIAIRDSIYTEDNLKRIEFLEAQYQAAKKEKDINKLQQEKQSQQFSIRQKSTLLYIFAGAFITLLAFSFLSYRTYKQKQLLHQHQIKQLQNEKLLLATESILKGQEDERSRLAQDLHDGLGGMLSGVKLTLSAMKGNIILPEESARLFTRAFEQLDSSIGEMRRVAHNMMPEALVKLGLQQALLDYCDGINAANGLNINCEFHGLENRLDNSTEIIVYRIVQELLNNIIKHANAGNVLVQVIKKDTELDITVEDNGIGFIKDEAFLKKGAGLKNIQSRVDYLKGELDIKSTPGKGTSVHINCTV
ncbi:MAG: sensor histidine kinase [Rhizobacter sp.]|nr:sensor histidine kinase [Ferruginibacter sp.]